MFNKMVRFGLLFILAAEVVALSAMEIYIYRHGETKPLELKRTYREDLYYIYPYPEEVREFDLEVIRESHEERLALSSYINLGIDSFKNRQFDKAKEYLEKAAKIDPECGEATFYLGASMISLGEVKGGVEMIKKAKQLRPDLYSWVLIVDTNKGKIE